MAQAGDAILLCRLGRIDYEAAWRWQRATGEAVRRGGTEAIAVLEHPPVYTVGAGGGREHLLASVEQLQRLGAQVLDVDRGGDITFHGPGQIVAYPVLDLRRRGLRPTEYVRALESALIATLAAFGIAAERVAGRPGVWAQGAKIAAIGVRVRGGITSHGLALNVRTDLGWFEHIVPCGIADAAVTSMDRLLAPPPAVEQVAEALAGALGRELGVSLVPAPPERASAPVTPETREEPREERGEVAVHGR